MNQLHNLDLQNAKELKHHSSSTFLKTCHMAIQANLNYNGKKQAIIWILKECIRSM
jgi:hypothetical protein